jgi:hypothetical protein
MLFPLSRYVFFRCTRAPKSCETARNQGNVYREIRPACRDCNTLAVFYRGISERPQLSDAHGHNALSLPSDYNPLSTIHFLQLLKILFSWLSLSPRAGCAAPDYILQVVVFNRLFEIAEAPTLLTFRRSNFFKIYFPFDIKFASVNAIIPKRSALFCGFNRPSGDKFRFFFGFDLRQFGMESVNLSLIVGAALASDTAIFSFEIPVNPLFAACSGFAPSDKHLQALLLP